MYSQTLEQEIVKYICIAKLWSRRELNTSLQLDSGVGEIKERNRGNREVQGEIKERNRRNREVQKIRDSDKIVR